MAILTYPEGTSYSYRGLAQNGRFQNKSCPLTRKPWDFLGFNNFVHMIGFPMVYHNPQFNINNGLLMDC